MLVHLTRYCNKVKAVCTRKHNSPPTHPLCWLVGDRIIPLSLITTQTVGRRCQRCIMGQLIQS